MEERTCTQCGESKLLSEYHLDKNASGGRRSQCKTCRSGKMKDWYADNQERQRDRQRVRFEVNRDAIRLQDMQRYERNKEARKALATQAWYRRLARLKSFRYNPAVTRAALRARDGDDCCYCGEAMRFTNPDGHKRHPRLVTIEHITPISRGGYHDWDNTALACWGCNSQKNGAEPGPWLELLAVRGFTPSPPEGQRLVEAVPSVPGLVA